MKWGTPQDALDGLVCQRRGGRGGPMREPHGAPQRPACRGRMEAGFARQCMGLLGERLSAGALGRRLAYQSKGHLLEVDPTGSCLHWYAKPDPMKCAKAPHTSAGSGLIQTGLAYQCKQSLLSAGRGHAARKRHKGSACSGLSLRTSLRGTCSAWIPPAPAYTGTQGRTR